MKSSRLSRNGWSADNGNGDEAAVNQPNEKVVLGDIIWVSHHGSSWWPSQVVDENTVNQNNKPRNQSASEVLVRLYGSYKYMYVDPMSCRTEFENILKQNNGNYGEIFRKALEQDLARLKSGRAKGKGSKSEGKVRVGSPQDKMSKQTIIEKSPEIESLNSTRASQELTARRMKVMRSLGLIAPSGSPFHRNGHINSNLSLCS